MRVPQSPSVRPEPVRLPERTAPKAIPQENLLPEQIARHGRAVEDFGGTLMEIDKDIQDRVDTSRAKEADAKIAEGYRQLLYSPDGYRSQLGRGAIDSREEFIKKIDEHRNRILETLTPRQREKIMSSDTARYQQARGVIDGHYEDQVRIDEVGEATARAETHLNDALDAYFDKDAPATFFEESVKGMHKELSALAERRGLGPEQTKKLRQAADDNLHEGVVDRLLRDGRAQDAKEYLKKANASESKRTELMRGVEVAVVKEQGNNLARAVSYVPGTLLDRVNFLVGMHTEGRIEVDHPDAVFSEALKNLTEHDKLVSAEMARQRSAAWDEIERHAQITRGQIDARHERLIDAAGLRDQYKLWTAQGKQFVTTDVGHYALTVMSPGELRRKFATEDLLKSAYYGQLSTTDWGHLRARWLQGNEDMPKLDKSIVYADGLRAALGKKPGDKVDKELFDRWKNDVDMEVRKLMAAKPGTKEEDHWAPAIEAARDHGFFLDPEGKQGRLFVEFPEANMAEFESVASEDIFIRERGRLLPGGGRAPDRMLQANMTAMMPGMSPPTTALEAAELAFQDEGIANPTLQQVVVRAYQLRERLTKQRRETGKQRVKEMFNEEYRNVVGAGIALEGPTTTEAAPTTQQQAMRARASAMALVQARRAEWEFYGITADEAFNAMGMTQNDRAQLAYDVFLRESPSLTKGMRGAKPPKLYPRDRETLAKRFNLDAEGVKQLDILAKQ